MLAVVIREASPFEEFALVVGVLGELADAGRGGESALLTVTFSLCSSDFRCVENSPRLAKETAHSGHEAPTDA